MVDCASSIRKKVRWVVRGWWALEMTEILSTMVAQKFVVVVVVFSSEKQLNLIETLQACHHCSPNKSCFGSTGLLFWLFVAVLLVYERKTHGKFTRNVQ